MTVSSKNSSKGNNPSLEDIDLPGLQSQFFKKLKAKGRSHNTLKNYKTDLECFNQYLQDPARAGDITEFNIPQIEQYGAYLQTRYSSDNSRRRRVQALRIFFDYLVEENVFNNNPVRKIPTSPKFLDIPRPTNFVDIKTLWEHLLDESTGGNDMSSLLARRNLISVLFIFGAGLKVSDLAKLSEEQVFLDGETPRVLIHPAKRDPYTIPLPDIFKDIYGQYIADLREAKRKSRIEFNEVLFNANPYRILSGGLSARGLEVVFEELRKKLMIKLTPKSLRQACIFKWLAHRESESQIKEWMGVAPSYSLKPYRDHLKNNIYDDGFLGELWQHYTSRK